MESEKYTARYFINKFEQIPEEKWVTGSFHRDNGSCALGHCKKWTQTDYWTSRETEVGVGLENLFGFHVDEWLHVCRIVVYVNDGKPFRSLNFQDLGDTPKERILNALCLIDNGLFPEAIGRT